MTNKHESPSLATFFEVNEGPEQVVSALEATELFDAKAVGPNTISAISVMGKHERLAGNVLRRMCKLGGGTCAQTCALHQALIERAEANLDKKCADENLSEVIAKLGTKPENIFMLGVTADGIGFTDEVDSSPDKYPYVVSPITHVKELPGFNAFFAREGDTIGGDEATVLGRRLADCGDVNLEFTDKDGKRVMGYMHMTKPNLQGEGAQKYDYNGQKVGSFEYFLHTALDHYGSDVSSVRVRVTAAIRPEHYIWSFESEEDMDKKGFIGWKDTLDENGKPLLKNQSNPDWTPGQTFNPVDKWHANFPAMLRWQMAQVKDMDSDQINWEGAIDPGDTGSQHASNYRGKTDPDADGRDAYFTAWVDKLSIS